jgi:hypothetical protein
MAADTTQLRVLKSTKSRLGRLGALVGFTQEQLGGVFLSECMDAIDATDYSDAPLPSIVWIRSQLHKPGRSLDEIITEKVAAAILGKYSNNVASSELDQNIAKLTEHLAAKLEGAAPPKNLPPWITTETKQAAAMELRKRPYGAGPEDQAGRVAENPPKPKRPKR